MRTSASNKNKRILAIDPGIANTGWALKAGKEFCCGTLKTSPKDSFKDRFDYILTHFENDHYYYDTLVIEDTFGGLVKTTGLLVGAFIGWLDPKELRLVPPAKWVTQMFGKENNGKFKKCALELAEKGGWCPDSQHAADAAAMLEWYLQYGKGK